MKKIKQLFKKGIALALAAVTTLSVLPAATVSAASERATITFAYCYDGNGNTIRYQQTFSHNGITCGHAGEARTRIYADGENAYCIEPGITLHTGNTLERDASVVWNNLGKEKQDAVNLALLYGAQGSMGSLSGTEDEKILTEDEEVIEVELINKLIEGSVRLTKVDAEYPANKLTGAVFELYADTDKDQKLTEKDELVGEIPEISEGIYQTDGLLYGGYFVKEKTAPEGFKLDENAYYFEISEDGKIVDVENEAGVGFINQPITGKLELTKTDVADGKPLPNAGFRIKDEDGNIVATGVTDENGIATFTLRYGKYTYQEYNAPEGYEINESEYAFEIKEDGQIVKATMTNEKIPEEVITTPKTGDDSRPGLWMALSALSGAGAAAFGILAVVKGKKKKEEEQA